MLCNEIIPDHVYIYTAEYPPGRAGHEYRVFKIIKQEPSKARQVIVECLTGPDAGVWFCCTPARLRLTTEGSAKEKRMNGRLLRLLLDREAGRWQSCRL